MLSVKHGQLIVVERNNEALWKNLDATIRQKILKYQGFDGNPWPLYKEWNQKENSNLSFQLYNSLGAFEDLKQILNYYKKVKNILNVKLISVEYPKNISNSNINFDFKGYDIGIKEEYEEPIFFSAILNEIRKNANFHFAEAEKKLNNNYLFSNINDCNLFLQAREVALKNHESEFIETAYQTNQYEIVPIFLYQEKIVLS